MSPSARKTSRRSRGPIPTSRSAASRRRTRRSTTPRVTPATAHELSRVGLLAELPGETLAKLAGRMEREQLPSGSPVVSEGDHDRRFYVLLSGLLAVSQADLGARRVLRPGD